MLFIIGLIGAIWAWRNVHPGLGVLVAVVCLGAAAWRSSGVRELGGPRAEEFFAAWKDRFGDMPPGSGGTNAAPFDLKSWLDLQQRNGMSAAEYLAALYPRIEYESHEPIFKDGSGATFRLVNGKWQWTYDPGVDGYNFTVGVMTETIINWLDRKLGRPLTFPHLERADATQSSDSLLPERRTLPLDTDRPPRGGVE